MSSGMEAKGRPLKQVALRGSFKALLLDARKLYLSLPV
jgi:hypothetical protein